MVRALRKVADELAAGIKSVERHCRTGEAVSISKASDLPEMVDVPLVGRIPAGPPVMTADDSNEEIFRLPRQLVGWGELFLVKVTGRSMINAGILDGDFAVVRQQEDAQNGDIVAARFEDEVTVKRLKRSDGHVWLFPDSPDPEYVPMLGDSAEIMGKVVVVLRRF